MGRKAPRELDLLIDGEWVKAQSEQTFQTYNPATGDLLAECAQGDEVDIDIAVRAARRAFESGPWSRLTATERDSVYWTQFDKGYRGKVRAKRTVKALLGVLTGFVAVAAAMQVNRNLSVPIVTAALALALAACGASGTPQNVGA